MKKVLILLTLAIGFASISSGQSLMTSTNYVTNKNVTGDTATAGTAKNSTLVLPGNWRTVSIVVAVIKLTGTIAGSINFQGSNDGVNFATLNTVTATDAAVGTATVYSFKEVDKGYLYYRCQMALTGTSTAGYFPYLYATKPY